MDEPKSRSVGRTLLTLFFILFVLGLTGVVLYLLSELNHRRYHVTVTAGSLVVERGRMFPFGSRPFEPESEDLRQAYAPIPVPQGVSVGRFEAFEDRADVDRALFGLMANWARERLEAEDPEVFAVASTYVDRCQLLPGLSEDQRRELRALRADLAFRRGRRLLEGIGGTLRQAITEFQLAKEFGAARQIDIEAWIAEVHAQLQAHEAALATPRRRGTTADGPPGSRSGEAPVPAPESGPDEMHGEQAPKWRL